MGRVRKCEWRGQCKTGVDLLLALGTLETTYETVILTERLVVKRLPDSCNLDHLTNSCSVLGPYYVHTAHSVLFIHFLI